MCRHVMDECIRDKSLHKIVLHCLQSWILSNLNNTYKSCIHAKNTHSVSLWKTSFVLHIVPIAKFWFTESLLQKNSCLDFRENNWLSHHHIKLPWSIVKRITFFTHVCDCSVKLNWFAETIMRNLTCFLVGTKENRQFSVHFAFELTPRQWSCDTENWSSGFGEFHKHLFRDMIPNSLWINLFHRRPLLRGT